MWWILLYLYRPITSSYTIYYNHTHTCRFLWLYSQPVWHMYIIYIHTWTYICMYKYVCIIIYVICYELFNTSTYVCTYRLYVQTLQLYICTGCKTMVWSRICYDDWRPEYDHNLWCTISVSSYVVNRWEPTTANIVIKTHNYGSAVKRKTWSAQRSIYMYACVYTYIPYVHTIWWTSSMYSKSHAKTPSV